MWRTDQVVWPSPWISTPFPRVHSLPLIATLNQSDTTPQTESPLFRLSPEIRVRIYNFVLQTVCDEDNLFPRRSLAKRPDLTGPRHIYTALLRSCRAVYAETWALPLLNTSLMIHEGSEEDRPPRKRNTVPHPSQQLFHLQAWQLLLIQNVHMTFQQIRIEGEGMDEWLRRIHDARKSAQDIVRRFVSDSHNDDELVKDFVEKSLIGVKIRSLTLRINRRDWWSWTSDPSRLTDEDIANQRNMLRVLKPNSPHSTIRYIDDDNECLFSSDFTLSMELETFGPKADQLDFTVNQAKGWAFEIPSLKQQEQSKSIMVWDGQVRDESWERERPDGIGWLKKKRFRDTGSRIEVRVIRFVPQQLDSTSDGSNIPDPRNGSSP